VAKTLLNGVNEVLKRVKVIAGDAGALTTLTDSARQTDIDMCVQVINEGVDELYSRGSIALPKEQAESSFTLVDGTRAYELASDLVQLRWPMIDKTNTQYLSEFPGGYNRMLLLDPEQNDTGLPLFGAIRPTDAKLFLDRAPTSVEAGRIYTYQYDKDLELTLAADEFPFTNPVFRAMVPAWVQLWKRERRNEFDSGMFKASLGRAASLMTMQQPRTSWGR
jgi:hypothetical protein